MDLAQAITQGRRAEALRLAHASSDPVRRALGELRVATWLEGPHQVRRAVLTVRGLVLATTDPAVAAEGWLDLAHGLVVTDPDAALRAASEASARGPDALGSRWAEAVGLRALLGEGEPPGAVSGVVLHGPLLLCAARMATASEEGAVAAASDLLLGLAEVEAPCRQHVLRWVALAERAAGWTRLGALAGPPILLDTLRATVGVAGRPAISFAGSRRRFDLLLALARHPDQRRETLFEEVWGHRWQGAASRNALQATVSRTRQALGDAVVIEVGEGEGYRLAGAPTVWVRGPLTPAGVAAEATALIGRTEDLARLREALLPGAWVGVSGPPGVGKSRLVREVSRTWPGRVVRVDLRGTTTRGGVLDALAERLATRPDRVGEALRGRAGTLVVLDDLDDLDEQPLDDLLHVWRRAGASTTVLTTHRRRLSADQVIELRPLTVEAGVELLAGHADGAVHGDTLRRLAESLDGLPLALEIVARHVALLGADEVLDVLPSLLEAGDPVASALDASWRGLSEGQRDDLGRLGLLGVSLPVAAARTLVPDDRIEALAARSLVARGDGTIELLRAVCRFAGPRLDPASRAEAVRALAGWAKGLEDTRYAGALQVLQSLVSVARAEAPEVAADLTLAVVPRLTEHVPPTAAVALVEGVLEAAPAERRDELLVVLASALNAAALDQQALARLDEVGGPLSASASGLALLVRARLASATHWTPALNAATPDEVRVAVDAAVDGTSGRAGWMALCHRSSARIRANDARGAREDLVRASAIAEGLGPLQVANTDIHLGCCDLVDGAYVAAVARLVPAVDRLRELGAVTSLRRSLPHLAWGLERLGRLDEAEASAREALALQEALGGGVPLAPILQRWASILQQRGDLDQALRVAWRAHDVGVGTERSTWHARAAGDLAAAVHFELGQLEAARLVVGDGADRTPQGELVRLLLATVDGDADRVEGRLGISETHSPAVLAMWGVLRHHFGIAGAAELVLQGREALPPDEVGSRHAVDVAMHLVLGEPLPDPVPQSWLARSLLAVCR